MLRMLLAFTLISQAALAAGGGDGVPTTLVTFQIINILLFLGLLVYFVRPKVREYFTNRKDNYIDSVSKAEKMKIEADKEKKEIEAKIASFKASAASEIEKAKADAESMKKNIIEQAKQLSANIESETAKTVENEMVKAKAALRASLLEQSLNDARSKFANISSGDHQKMNKQFIDGLGAN